MKTCSRCQDPKPKTEFGKDSSTGDGLRCYCKPCGRAYWNSYSAAHRDKLNLDAREYRAKNPEAVRGRVRRSFFKTRYGLTLEQLERMRQAQNNKCLLCLGDFNPGWGKSGPAVDHCHTSGKVRGLLCCLCNTALGKFKDSQEVLARAIQYLQKNS